jgi:hypothetical protein
VVGYAVEWETVVTGRVDKELKQVRKLQADRRHYERKVESLRQRANDMEAKGKASPSASAIEKLHRNEEKLKEAYMVHEAAAGRLCVLIETVTQDGWKDLYHLAKNFMKWESNRVGRESDIYCQLSNTLDSMRTSFKKDASKKTKVKKSKKVSKDFQRSQEDIQEDEDIIEEEYIEEEEFIEEDNPRKSAPKKPKMKKAKQSQERIQGDDIDEGISVEEFVESEEEFMIQQDEFIDDGDIEESEESEEDIPDDVQREFQDILG